MSDDEHSDPEDILSSSLQTLYDYIPITHSSGGDKFTYKNTSSASPITVTLRTPDPKAANWSLHASSIWMSSIYAVDHLEDLQLDLLSWDGSPEGGPRLLELGAAAGLPGIVIAQAYPLLEVTVSDYPDENLISALSDNVITNATSKQCRVVPYAWGSESSAFAPHAPFDVILACDTLWNPDLHTIFLESLCDLLKKTDDARIHLIAGLHTGRFTLHAFMLAVQAAGLYIRSTIEKEVIGSQKREWNAERDDSEQERRRWIVWMTLSWPTEKVKNKSHDA